jgi:ABC-type uncharacterized transport system ATPase subunit
MEVLVQRYIKDPHLAQIAGKSSHKFNMVEHCNNLVGIYTKAAEEADELSHGHRSMLR